MQSSSETHEPPADADGSLISGTAHLIKEWLFIGDDEEEDRAVERLENSFCDLVDAIRVPATVSALEMALRDMQADIATQEVAQSALAHACQRARGELFGQPYAAQMMLMPVVMRGSYPQQFPRTLDAMTAARISAMLRSAIGREGIFVFPFDVVLSQNEMANQKPAFVNEVVRSAFEGCRNHTPQSAPSFILAASPEAGYRPQDVDSQLYNLDPADGAYDLIRKGDHERGSGSKKLSKLKAGCWTTSRVLPVVVAWPRAMPQPSFNAFSSPLALRFGDALSFCSVHSTDACEATDVRISALGLFDFHEASVAASLASVRDRMVLEVHDAAMQLVDPASMEILMNYVPGKAVLLLEVRDSRGSIGRRIPIQPAQSAHLFIENLTSDLRSLGMRVQVDEGDNMIRFESATRATVQ